MRLDAKEHPTHLPIHKNRAGALLCLLTHPFFAHLWSGLLIQTAACIAINCIQAVCRIATAQVEIFLSGGLFKLEECFETEDFRPDYKEKPWVNIIVRKR